MSSGLTTMRAGSLLDDNQWHDVEINRVGREVNFTVDRLTIMNMTNGDFYQLDLDRTVLNLLTHAINIIQAFFKVVSCINSIYLCFFFLDSAWWNRQFLATWQANEVPCQLHWLHGERLV